MRAEAYVDAKELAPIDLTIQKMYHMKLIHLNELVIKYDLGEGLNYKDMKKLLYYVILFTDLMRPELLRLEDPVTHEILGYVDLYRVDKEKFLQNAVHNVVVFWGRSGKFIKAEVFPDYKVYEAKKQERYVDGLREMKIEVLPKVEHLIYLAKQILDIGTQLGILNLIIAKKPHFVVFPEVHKQVLSGMNSPGGGESG